MRKIIIEDYNPEWAEHFKDFKCYYETLFEGIKYDIQHVGSTSVEGLAAKPIIDIDIIVYDEKDKLEIIRRLETVGYEHQGNLGIKGREAFSRASEQIPYTKDERKWMDHHLYCCMNGVESLENHLKLRKWLKTHPEDVKAYSELKKNLAKKYIDDIDSYVEDKTAFITNCLKQAGMKTDTLEDITLQNKRKTT